MKHTTRWRPDTCACVLEFEWDDEDSEEIRAHNAIKVERCGAHPHEGEPNQNVFETVHRENQHKNTVLQHLLDGLDDAHIETNAQGHRAFKHDPSFQFDEARQLRVTFPTAPDSMRAAARATLAKIDLGDRTVEVH
jgi:hypothetical protein